MGLTEIRRRRFPDAVVKHAVDVALVWGPLAGYYAKHSCVPLRLEPVSAAAPSSLPMCFEISVGVSRKEPQLLAQINGALQRDAPQIRRLLG
jgi:mxaJ protein